MDKLIELLGSLEERLVEHDESRKEVQSELGDECSKRRENAASLEEEIGGEIGVDFDRKEKRIFGLIEKLNEGEGDLGALIKEAKEELSKEWKYEIQPIKPAEGSVDSYKLNVYSVEVDKKFDSVEPESIVTLLQEHLEELHESMIEAQERLAEVRKEGENDANDLERRINGKLEEVFKQEDARIQEVVKLVKEKIDSEDPEEVKELTRKARLTLLKNQRYTLETAKSYEDCGLRVVKEASLEHIDFEERKPRSLIPSFTKKGEFSLSFAFFDEDEAEVLKEVDSPFEVEVKAWAKGHEEGTSRTLTKKLTLGSGDEPIFLRSTFTASTAHCLKMRIAHQGMRTQWSDVEEFTTPEFKECCVWKECPDDAEWDMKYSVDEENPRVATKIDGGYKDYCTIIGNTPLPSNAVTSWSIKILKSEYNDGGGICTGVAPSDINQNEGDNSDKCGWYFNCYGSTLYSGPPHNYRRKEYGPRKGFFGGQYIHIGDSVGVVMDTTKGELSFVLNGVNLGVAYEGIPLDKPLVPCVLLYYEGDSVELDTSEVKETAVVSSIPIPTNITAKSTTWDSITLTWDVADGASFYQIEVDSSKFWDVSTANTFTMRGLRPDTEYTFRVRAVRGNSVSEWSDAVRGRVQKASINFSGCVWKECPDNVDMSRKYFVDKENVRIATKIGYGVDCTIIGNTPLPPNKVTSWSIKILESRRNNGNDIFIGVAPFDINQNEGNYDECGWYFDCYGSTLCSGPPHSYEWKEYGPRKEKGQYVHTGDSVGVVMDTAKGELSFVLNGVNLGVAYEGIPLDKPLVPCVILRNEGDSVELVI